MNSKLLVDRQWESYLDFGIRKFVKKDTVLYNLGDTGSGFYYIYKGIVQIIIYTTEGEEKCFDFRGSGHFCGEYALINEPNPTSAITKEDCILYYFSNDNFRKIINSSDDSFILFLKNIYRQIWGRTERNLLITNTEKRIVWAILRLNELSSAKSTIHITQQELANYLGLTRITVNKVLQSLKKNGIIEINNKMIVIKNLNYLVKIIEDDE